MAYTETENGGVSGDSSTAGADGLAGARFAPAALAVVFGLAMFTLAGCSDIFDIEDTENVTGPALEDSPDLLVNRALSDFQVGYSGGGNDDKILSVSALMTDEFASAGTFTTRTATDQRDQFPSAQGNTSDAGYGELHDARIAARDAAGALQEQGRSGDTFALMRALEAFTIVGLAENYCSGVPLSTSENFGPGTPGQPLSTSQLLEEAISLFDEAASAGSGEVVNLAAVGKGRALLGLGRFSEAASAVSGVPTSFVWKIEHSANSGTEENPIFNLQDNGRYTVSNGEGDDENVGEIRVAEGRPGANGVAFHHKDGDPSNAAGDPRVPWIEDPAGGFDSSIPLFYNLNYGNRSVGVPLASGVEARLIEAEADVQSGAFGAAESTLNDLRADVQSLRSILFGDPTAHAYPVSTDPADINGAGETLDPLALPANTADATDVLFRERAFWLYNTAHRLGDLRRLMRAPYSRAEDDVFPSGNYMKGGTYGDDVNFWIDFDETNNPNFSIDMCNVEAP